MASQVSNLQTRCVSLVTAQRRISEVANLHRALLAPIRKLPVELLTEIFLFAALPESEARWRGASHVLAAVCLRWRQVALSTPHLWACIVVIAGSSSLTLWRESVRTRLERSSYAPLTITWKIYGRRAFCSGDPYWDADIWALLCTQAHRWASAHLGGFPSTAFNAQPRTSFPQLSTLLLHPIHPGSIGFFANAPNCTVVRLEYASGSDHLLFPTRWHLSVLHLHFQAKDRDIFFMRMCMQALASCSAMLRNCTLYVPPNTVVHFDPTSTIVAFPRLETLRLDGRAYIAAYNIAAPRLVHLAVDGGQSQRTFDSLSALVGNSGGCSHLQWAGMMRVAVVDEELLESLTHSPFITVLDLLVRGGCQAVLQDDRTSLTHVILQALTRQPGDVESARFLPRLRTLYLRFEHFANFPEEQLREEIRQMVHSRRAGGTIADVHMEPLANFETDCGGEWP